MLYPAELRVRGVIKRLGGAFEFEGAVQLK